MLGKRFESICEMKCETRTEDFSIGADYRDFQEGSNPSRCASPESSNNKGSGDFFLYLCGLADFLRWKTRNDFRLPERFFIANVKRNVKRNQHKKEAMPPAADAAALSSCIDSI